MQSLKWRLAALCAGFLFVCLLGTGIYLSRFMSAGSAVAFWAGLGAALVIAPGLIFLLVNRSLRALTVSLHKLKLFAYRLSESSPAESEIPRSPREVGALSQALYQTAALVQARLAQVDAEKERFTTLLSHMVDPLLTVNRDGIITLLNAPAGQLFHVTLEAAAGRTFMEVVRDHELNAIVQRCLAQGTPQNGFVETMPGRQFLEIIVTALPDKNGCLAIIHDLTRLRRLETIRRDFVSNISHELRTPISSIKALAETLRDGAGEDPAVARDFLEKITVEADRMAQMVEELGELSRIEYGQIVLDKSPLNLKSAVSRAVARMAAQAERAGLTVKVDMAEGLPPALADAVRIEQVLVNLLHNAIKFTPAGGRIGVGAQLKDGALLITVSDTGTGIAEDDLPRIFERFYKADKARTGGGTGLGLAIAKHIIEAHGGHIWAESEEGRGAIFYFTLPRARES